MPDDPALMPLPPGFASKQPWGQLAGVALAIGCLSWFVLHYFDPARAGGLPVTGSGSVFYLTSGVALAAVILGGRRYLLAIWLGTLVSHQLLGYGVWSAFDAPLGAAAGVWFVRRHADFDDSLPDLPHLFRMLGGGILGALVSAGYGTAVLLAQGLVGRQDVLTNLLLWWMGDVLGVLLMTPLLLLCLPDLARQWQSVPRRKVIEATVIIGLMVLLGMETHLQWGLLGLAALPKMVQVAVSQPYWLFAYVALVGVRVGRIATCIALLVAAVINYTGTYHGVGSFAHDGPDRLISFWFFHICLTLVGLSLAFHTHTNQRLRRELAERGAAVDKELLNIHNALNLHTAVAILDGQGRVKAANAVFCQACGYLDDELVGQLPQHVLASTLPPAADYQSMADQMALGQPWEGELASCAKDGHMFWWAASVSPVLGNDGHPASFVMLATDITSRKLSEQLIKDYQQDLEDQVREKTEYLQQALNTLFVSEERYRFLLDESSDPIFSFSPEIRYTYANAAFATPLGKTPEQVIGSTPHDVMPAVEADKRVSGVRSVFAQGKEIVSEVRVPTANGDRYFLTNAKPVVNALQQVVMVLCISKDITYLRQARADLQSTLSLLSSTLDATEQAIIVMDTQGKLKLWNRRFLELWDLQPQWLHIEDLVQTRQHMSSQLIDPNQMAHVSRSVTAPDSRTMELVRFKDGRIIKRSSQPQLLDGEIVGRVWSYTDITELEQQKEALRNSETRFSLAVDGADQGIWDYNLITREMYHSPRMAGMLGYTQAELPPKFEVWAAMLPAEILASYIAGFKAHIKNPALPFEFVLPLRHRDGTMRSIQSRGRATFDVDGQAVRVTGTHTDITSQLQAEQQLKETLALLNATLESTDEGIVVLSASGHIDLWNRRFVELWGVDEQLLLNQDLTATRSQMATRMPDPQAYLQSLAALYQDPERSLLDIIKLTDGRVLRRVSHPKMMDGKAQGRVWSYADVTELKHAEESAQAADQAKSEFLANMSHEIRTPMNGVVGMVDILQQTPLSDEQRRMLDVVQHSAQDLLGILNDILDFAKIEAGKLALEPRPTDLHLLVNSAMQLMQASASGQGVALQSSIAAELPQWIHTDPTRLRQVLLNLLGNAIKFTAGVAGRAGQVSLTVLPAVLPDGGAALQFCVADNGIGMAADVVARLFAPFMQADASTARRFGGTGLGLSISQRLLELLGGSIAVQSTLGQGTRFTVTLPMQLAQATPPDDSLLGLQPAAGFALPAVQILLAEDNQINVDVLSQQLRLLGCTCSVAMDGAQALKQWQTGHFDLLLTDCHMPVMDGFELARAIRQQEPAGTHLPIMAITANAMKGEAQRCFAAGMDAYLTKPIRLRELAAQLSRFITCAAPADVAPDRSTEAVASAPEVALVGASLSPVWRAATLGELVGGNSATQTRLLQKFLLSARTHIDTVTAAAMAGQYRRAVDAAHALKSSARTVGAMQLGELCQQIETICRSDQTEACQAAIQVLPDSFAAASQCIQAALDEIGLAADAAGRDEHG